MSSCLIRVILESYIGSRFGGEEIRDSSRLHTRNPSHRKWGNGSATIAFIPFGPGGPIENPRCWVIQCRNEIGIAEVLADDFNVLIRSIRHRVGEKPQREFKCLFWRPKPEDALGSNQKFCGVDHRSLPCQAKSRFATSTGSSKSSEARCPRTLDQRRYLRTAQDNSEWPSTLS